MYFWCQWVFGCFFLGVVILKQNINHHQAVTKPAATTTSLQLDPQRVVAVALPRSAQLRCAGGGMWSPLVQQWAVGSPPRLLCNNKKRKWNTTQSVILLYYSSYRDYNYKSIEGSLRTVRITFLEWLDPKGFPVNVAEKMVVLTHFWWVVYSRDVPEVGQITIPDTIYVMYGTYLPDQHWVGKNGGNVGIHTRNTLSGPGNVNFRPFFA